MSPLILASSSSARKLLLERLQLPFLTCSPEIDETPLSHETPPALALRLAQQKAQAVAQRYPDALIIGADQVIMCGTVRLDKPGTVENALAQLRCVSNRSVESFTGLCLLHSASGRLQTQVEQYAVTFRPLTEAMMRRYVERDQPLQCAGSIKAEGLGITLFDSMAGRDFTALIGLPLIALTTMLQKEGIVF